MSDPIITNENRLQQAMIEIVSGMSALNMPPKPIENPPRDAEFLSELDAWAKHSIEHFEAALHMISKEAKESYDNLCELRVKIAELKATIKELRNEKEELRLRQESSMQ